MELFTLGADRGANQRRTCGSCARADVVADPTGTPSRRPHSASRRPATTTEQDRLRQLRRLDLGGRPRLCVEHPLHPSFFVHEALELLHPHAAVAADRQRSSAVHELGLPGAAGPRGDPPAPRAAHGPAHGEAARRARWPGCAGCSGADRRRVPDLALGGCGPAALLPPDVSGWDDSRWLDTSTVRGRCELIVAARPRPPALRPRRDAYDATEMPTPPVAAARAFWGDPYLTAETVALLRPSPPPACRRGRLAAAHLSRPAPERAAPTDPRLPRLPDELTMANCGCDGYSRTQLLRRAAARPDGGSRRLSPGCRRRPARGSPGARSCRARPGWPWRSTAPRASARAFEQGIAAAAAQAPANDRVLVSVFLAGGADSLTHARADEPTRSTRAAAGLALPGGEGTAFSEDPRCAGTPRSRASRRSTARARSASCRRSATPTPNQSHFTCRHYWEVGEPNPFGRPGWLGRYLDAHGCADNPLQGLALGWDLQPSWPPRACRWRPCRAGRLRLLGARASGGGRGRCSTPSATSGTRRRATRAAQARAAVAATGRLREQLAPFQPASRPGRLPTRTALRRPAARARGDDRDGLPLKVVAIERGGYDTHANQDRPSGDSRGRRACSHSSATSRRAALAGPRAHAGLERVRPPAEETAPAPTTEQAAPACDRLAGARPRWSVSSRGSRRSHRATTFAPPPTFVCLLLAAREARRRRRGRGDPRRVVLLPPRAGAA